MDDNVILRVDSQSHLQQEKLRQVYHDEGSNRDALGTEWDDQKQDPVDFWNELSV